MIELRVGDARLACAAVLFDLDGTLVDSTACVEGLWRSWCARHGLDAEELLRISHGRQNRATIRAIAPHLDTPAEIAALQRAEESARDGIVPVRGAARLLRSLPGDRWGIVTSAWRTLAEIRLRHTGLPVPDVLVTADDTTASKPDPAGYLLAAERLGVPASACVVVEDAPAGAAAGRAAGMRVVGVATTFEAGPLSCDWCVDDLESLGMKEWTT